MRTRALNVNSFRFTPIKVYIYELEALKKTKHFGVVTAEDFHWKWLLLPPMGRYIITPLDPRYQGASLFSIQLFYMAIGN